MQVIPDGYPFALPIMQTLPFLVAMVALHFILFRPLLAYLAVRDEATAGAREEAAELQAEVDARMTELEASLGAAHAEARAARAEARAEALAQEQEILLEARAEADEELKNALERVRAESKDASVTLRSTAVTLSRDIANQVLGRSISA